MDSDGDYGITLTKIGVGSDIYIDDTCYTKSSQHNCVHRLPLEAVPFFGNFQYISWDNLNTYLEVGEEGGWKVCLNTSPD